MSTLELTDDEAARIERLREEIEASHAGPYATVQTGDVLAYLLDLADAVDDPDRSADPETGGVDSAGSASDTESDPGTGSAADRGSSPRDRESFPRDGLRERLEERNLKHADPDDESRMDLYAIAAEYDVSGRSEMTKAELVEGILDAVERLYADPLAPVDVDVFDAEEADGEADDDGGADDGSDAVGIDESGAEDDDGSDADGDGSDVDGDDGGGSDDEGSGQLNAMLSLLETHDDKWHEADGDARYEVDLPDGTVETARTKDDVRALLFKNY